MEVDLCCPECESSEEDEATPEDIQVYVEGFMDVTTLECKNFCKQILRWCKSDAHPTIKLQFFQCNNCSTVYFTKTGETTSFYGDEGFEVLKALPPLPDVLKHEFVIDFV